jgi:hypothetical protein
MNVARFAGSVSVLLLAGRSLWATLTFEVR